MTTKDIQQRLIDVFATESIIVVNERSTQPILQIPVELLISTCQFLHDDELLFFDFLACVTGIDNGPDKGTVEIIYHLTSIPYQRNLVLKIVIPRQTGSLLPSAPSVSGIWQTANWHERETFDLIGISFENHPDLRRILLPKDWEGYPLRKDYEEQDSYHGIKVKY
ncbi:NADH-quinone oxidoreductase subunit C [Runella sp.]|uniref:NADH-quinone oxidoreductase subunit C n=1 Tax=Runella sp. TaxID=1960881 RepID=UPI003D114E14